MQYTAAQGYGPKESTEKLEKPKIEELVYKIAYG